MATATLWICSLIFAGLVLAAMASDFRTMLIGNRLSIGLVLAFLPAGWATGLGLEGILFHIGIGAVFLAVGIALFSLGLIGGGDVKLAAASAVWFGWPGAAAFLFLFALSGGVLAGTVALLRRFPILPKRMAVMPWLSGKAGVGIPYGLAIGLSALTVFLFSPVGVALRDTF